MSEPITYEDAVAFATEYLDSLSVQTAGPDMLRQLRFRFAARAGLASIDADGNRFEPDQDYESKSVEKLVELLEAPASNGEMDCYKIVLTGENTEYIERLIVLAEASTIAHDALVDVAASMVRNGFPFKGKMRDWVADHLQGKVTRSGRSGRLRAQTLGRDLYIIGAIIELVERGLSATRNDVSAPTSACDAVSDALRHLDVSPRSYSSVKRIWLNAERVLRYF